MRRSRTRTTATPLVTSVLALLLAIALTGCGGNDTSESDRSSSGDSSGDGNGQDDQEGQDAKRPAPQYKRLTKAQLDQVLLTIEDLPPGYSADPKDDSSSTAKYCGSAPPKVPVKSKARQDFTKGGGFSSELASVSVVQYRSAATAARHYKRLRAGLATCKGETVSGDQVTYALMSTPKTGHPTLGIRVSAKDFTVLIDIAQVGPSLVNSGSGGITTTDADLAASLLMQQVDKYKAAAAPGG